MKAGRAKHKRKLKNFLLQPLIQVKLGLYSIIMAVVFSVVFCSVVVVSFQRLFDLILDLTDLRDEVVEIINAYLIDIGGWLVLIVAIYLVLNIFVSILYTHRLVGPTIAFRRQIKAISEGRYNARITLRKQDAFNEVAEDLNNLAAQFEKKAK